MIFSSVDPRGYRIACNSGTWNNHIITGHTIMAGNENDVKKTIEDPDVIYRSSQTPVRNVYFSKGSSSNISNLYVKVIVQVDDKRKTGEVISAWPQKTISGGIDMEGVLYVKPKL